MADKLHMEAYYYEFEPTGDPAIDLILSAVAVAGKAEHSTMHWPDEITGYTRAEPFTGNSPVEWIQNAANDAAKARATEADLVEALRMMIDEAVELAESGDAGFWDAEKVPSMIKARAAIAAYEGKANE